MLNPPFQPLRLGFTPAVHLLCCTQTARALSYIPLLRLTWIPAVSSPYVPSSRMASSLSSKKPTQILPIENLACSLGIQPGDLNLASFSVLPLCTFLPPAPAQELLWPSQPMSPQHRMGIQETHSTTCLAWNSRVTAETEETTQGLEGGAAIGTGWNRGSGPSVRCGLGGL